MGWCRLEPWRVNFYSIKKKKGLPIHPRPLHVSSEKFNFTRVNRYLEERYVTNPSLPSLCIGLNSRFGEGMEMPNFFSQLMESVRFVLWKIFSNLIPLQLEGDNEEYREYRVWAPLLRNFVLIHLLNLIPSQFPSEISNVERELYFNPLLWNFTSLWIPLQFHPAKYRILNYITPYCETRYIYIYINSNS